MVAFLIGLYVRAKRRAKRLPSKMERRSSIASSIFLPRKFRRNFKDRSDAITPYIVDLRQSRLDSHASSASSVASIPYTYQRSGDEVGRGEKGRTVRSLPTPVALPPIIIRADTSERRSSPSCPITHVPSEVNPQPTNTVAMESSTLPHAPVYPPPAASRRIDDPSFIERIVESVAQRIDARRLLPGRTRADSVNELPPYTENV